MREVFDYGRMPSSLKKATVNTVLFFTLLLGSNSCTEKQKISGKFPGENVSGIVDSVRIDSLKLCRTEMGKVFLREGEKILTKNFDSIAHIGEFDKLIYFVAVDKYGNKSALIDENGKVKYSGHNNDIQEYYVHNGNVLVIDKIDGEFYLFYNKELLDKGGSYYTFTGDKNTKNGIYVVGSYIDDNGSFLRVFIDGKKIGPDIPYSSDNLDNIPNFIIEDYGKTGHIAKITNQNQKDEVLMYKDGDKTVIVNANNTENLNNDSELIKFKKDGKSYVLLSDGNIYKINLEFGGFTFIKSEGGELFYIVRDELHKYEGKYKEIKGVGTYERKEHSYFVGINSKGLETFVYDGKIIGSTEKITGWGFTMDGEIILRGREFGDHSNYITSHDIILIEGKKIIASELDEKTRKEYENINRNNLN